MVHESMGITCTSTNEYRRVEQLEMNSGFTELILFCFSFSTTCFSEGSCLIESCTSVTLSAPYVIENHCNKSQSISLFSMSPSIWTQFCQKVFLHLSCNLRTAVDSSQQLWCWLTQESLLIMKTLQCTLRMVQRPHCLLILLDTKNILE